MAAAGGAGASGTLTRAQAIELGLPADQVDSAFAAFAHFDADKSGKINVEELRGAMRELGEEISEERARELVREVDTSGDGEVDLNEFVRMLVSGRASGMKVAAKRVLDIKQVEGAVGKHSYADEEKVAFTEHLNNCFRTDEYLQSTGLFPLDPHSSALFHSVHDGIVLCKLINLAVSDTVDERSLNFPKAGKKLNPWEIQENQNLCINSAKSIGCQVVNIHATDLTDCVAAHKEYLVLGLIWQIVKVQLLSAVNLKHHPELLRLVREGETLADLVKLPPEDILIRWVNFHLEAGGCPRRITNLGSDLRDSVVYVHLLHNINPEIIDLSVATSGDETARAIAVIDAAKRMEVPAIIQPSDIVRGNKRLNLAFCAQVFNTNPGLEIKEEEVAAAMEAAGLMEDDTEGGREERTFRMWMNSLELQGGERYVHNMSDDLADGVVLLEVIEKVHPGTLDPKKYTADPAKLAKNPYKKIENCNYVIDLCKALGLSVPGIGGKDIADKKGKLVAGIVWQLMRLQVVNMLKAIGGGSAPKDTDIIAWANSTVAAAGKGTTPISSFKDKSIGTGVFLLDLLSAIEPRIVNPELCTAGETDEDKKNNARYVISVARKIGCSVFLTWEDIVDVKQKMVMTLVASIMFVAGNKRGGAAGGGGGGGGGSA